METSTSQKILKVFGILNIIFGIIAVIAAILVMAVGGYGAATLDVTDPEIAEGTGAIIGSGIASLISGILEFVLGILALRAAKDATKVQPVWIYSIICLIVAVISLITSFGSSGDRIASAVITLIFDALIFYAANNVKKQAA